MAGPPRIGVAFLARGFHPDWAHALARFVTSYERFPAGVPHRLYVIFKGYRDAEHLAQGQRCFSGLEHVPLYTHDEGFDIGCYQRIAPLMAEEFVCFLNTKSEILGADWLRHLLGPFTQADVGLVGNTGSYESIRYKIPAIPPFPNPHIRTNAFLVRRALFCAIASGFEIRTKNDGWMFECGPDGFSRQVLRRGLKMLVVGRDGAVYEPARWPISNTYRSPAACPLIGDDASREFCTAGPERLRDLIVVTWGPAADEAGVRAGQGCAFRREPFTHALQPGHLPSA